MWHDPNLQKMKRTPFYKQHVELGGKMVPFAGWEMPVEFAGVKQEHVHVRSKVGVFDVSHMGEAWIKGPAAFELVQHLTSNDVALLEPGKIQYSCFPNGEGGIVDDLLVYHFEADKYLLVINASNTDKDLEWINKNNSFGAEVENASDQMAQLAVQGPDAIRVLQKMTGEDLSTIPYYTFKVGAMGGVDEVIISNTGYTGAGGFELYVDNADADQLYKALLEAGSEFDLQPIGLAARDTLRLEMGFCLYGNDIDDSTTPIEAGLGWITKFNEGNDFIDRERLEKQKAEGPARRLVGFELQDRGIPRQHYPILDASGRQIGEVTSGTMSPMTGKAIGMGYVETAHSKKETAIFIGVRNKQLRAVVVRPPFYKPGV